MIAGYGRLNCLSVAAERHGEEARDGPVRRWCTGLLSILIVQQIRASRSIAGIVELQAALLNGPLRVLQI